MQNVRPIPCLSPIYPICTPPPPAPPAYHVMNTRVLVAALAPGLLLALVFCTGEAAAQTNVCGGGPYTGADGATIACTEGTGSSNDIEIDPGSVNVALINADHRGSGDITIRVKPGVTVTGSGGNSILASRRGSGASSIVITGGTLTGIASSTSYGAPGTVSVSMSGGTLSGRLGAARNGGTGNAYVTVSGDATIRSTAINAYGVFATNNGLGDELSVRVTGGSVETTGSGSHGIFVNASNNNGATAGSAMSVDLEGGSVRTRGNAHGVYFASYRGSRDASFRMTGGSIVTEADDVHSVDFWLRRFATGQTASARMTGGSIVAEGLDARGLASLELNLGSLDVMTGAGAEIAAPFAVGMEGLLEVDASPTGRLVFAHGGAVEAREVGVLARAARSSGHTMGGGAQWADDAARTMPMIHVTSSGDVTVGASVSDAFIRARVAGADETLSTGEQAVLSAITAGDSDALTTALTALSDDDYDADWKAEAQDLLRKRTASSAAPTGDGPLAQRAGEEILGLSRAGVRAYALSHTGIVDHVRAGDALSDAERTVLDAVLTKGVGSELETALTALTGGAYTTAWKNTVRRLAATYNAGDIQVEVTGGTITAEGNGVEALYAVPHDSNGDITVSVAEGARVTGGANGLYVRGGGAGAGSLRAQEVTVDGRVTGGTGAGVRMVGGGRLTVGSTGRVGATSGVGVLSDGAGDLHATVAGTVEGDVRVRGGGTLMLDVREGGAVTGTVHDPVGPLTVVGSIGRLLYTNGGAVTVAATGALTGVEVGGKTEALRSESGDLSLTVADKGMVTGDVQAGGGGTLMLDVREGGTVTGTVHDPVGPLTVVGSIGRLLYTNGGAVTVAATGALTGVEVGGKTEALRSESGNLSLTVADKGMVTGDVQAGGGGTLMLDVREGGTVAGTVYDPAGPLTVVGSIGRLLYTNGGAVTVAATGALTGVEVGGKTEALRSESGDLSLTVADKGMVTGDVQAGGGGTLMLDVREGGTVAGTVHDPAGPLTVVGSIGRLLYTNGGAVTVAATGALTGVEVDGKTEALRSQSGDLSLTVADEGMVTGDVLGLGAGDHTVRVVRGGTVTGAIRLAASRVDVDGSVAGYVRLDRGGVVTVGAGGRIAAAEGAGVRSETGNLDVTVAGTVNGIDAGGDLRLRVDAKGMVTGGIEHAGDLDLRIQAAEGERPDLAAARASRWITDKGDRKVRIIIADGKTLKVGPSGTSEAAPWGPYDVGLVTEGRSAWVVQEYAPRSRVYEALPSVLLGLNRLPEFRERAARAPGGGWAQVEAFRGKWNAAGSTTPGLEYDYRRHGLRAGFDAAVTENGLFGVSAHRRGGSADVSGGGRMDLSGAGVGVSWASRFADAAYMDLKAEWTWYEADLFSSLRGALKKKARARGHALGVEIGRRAAAGGLVLTPRVQMARSTVSAKGFTDAVGARVSPTGGRSLTGAAGVAAELDAAPGTRVFGALDAEREFSAERKVRVSGEELRSSADAMWFRVRLGGVHAWNDGRYAFRGGASYATAGDSREFGGGVGLRVRF